MTIKLNPDKELVKSIRKRLEENDRFCPCALVKAPETKCMCKDFMQMEEGMCHCGLYIKTKD